MQRPGGSGRAPPRDHGFKLVNPTGRSFIALRASCVSARPAFIKCSRPSSASADKSTSLPHAPTPTPKVRLVADYKVMTSMISRSRGPSNSRPGGLGSQARGRCRPFFLGLLSPPPGPICGPRWACILGCVFQPLDSWYARSASHCQIYQGKEKILSS